MQHVNSYRIHPQKNMFKKDQQLRKNKEKKFSLLIQN